jgi:hypothetical protein
LPHCFSVSRLTPYGVVARRPGLRRSPRPERNPSFHKTRTVTCGFFFFSGQRERCGSRGWRD